MKAYNKFIKKIKEINIEVLEYRFLEGVGWVKTKDFDNLPNNLKKAYYWELENLNENRLKQLQSDAVNELTLLSDDQLKKTLKRLDFLNEFERFNEFVKIFYVKVDNETDNGLDVSDFKILLDNCFYVDVPNKGNISIDFLTELTDQIFFKSALLDGLKWQIENLLPKEEQTKETDYWQDDADENILISEYGKAVNKLIKGDDTGCFPMRFRMLPRIVLNENKYSTERKKYLLKQMRLVLDDVKNTEIGSELFTDLRQRIEPYEDIFSFVFSTTALPPQQTEKPKPEPKEIAFSEEIKKLKSIWLAEPKLTVEYFLQKGIDKGFWNNDLELTLQRDSSTYGTGKTFLGNVFRAFRGWAIPNHLDYKEAGKIFCEVFNIEVKKSTKEPYKLFSSGNDKQIREVKRTFDVK